MKPGFFEHSPPSAQVWHSLCLSLHVFAFGSFHLGHDGTARPWSGKPQPPEAFRPYDVILVSDVVWADGYGRLPIALHQLVTAHQGCKLVLGGEQRGHKRPELGSPVKSLSLLSLAGFTRADAPRIHWSRNKPELNREGE